MRPFYEEDQRVKAEQHAEWKRLRKLNARWDAETLKHEIDFDSLARPKHTGPIFTVFRKNNWDFAEIHVDWEGQRMPLIDVLKIWEKHFDEKIAGGYGWIVAGELYESLVIKVRKGVPFHEILCCSSCGDSYCWSFRIEVRETDKLVVWTNFRQPRRNKYPSESFWDYSEYPPFVFDKKQYYEELEQL